MDWIDNSLLALIISCGFLLIVISVVRIKWKKGARLYALILVLIVPIFVFVFSLYANIIHENDNNLVDTISSRIKPSDSLDLTKNLINPKIPDKYFICLDISATSDKKIASTPDWFNKNSFYEICKKLGVDQEKRDQFIPVFKDTIKRSHLIQFKTLELLSTLNDTINNRFQIITFGKSYKVIYPPDKNNYFTKATYDNKRNAGNNILDLKFKNKDTDFENLFTSLLNSHQYGPLNSRSNYIPSSKHIVILSDFEHDVKGQNKKQQKAAFDNVGKKLETIVKSDFNLVLFNYNYVNKQLPIINKIDSTLKKHRIIYKHYGYHDKNQFLFSSYILPIKINMPYFKNSFDKSIAHVTKFPVKEKDFVWVSLENQIGSNYSWKLLKKHTSNSNNNWTPFIDGEKNLLNGIRKDIDCFTIKYEGPIPNRFPNTNLRILLPSLKKEVIIGFIFTKKAPNWFAWFVLIILGVIFILEIIYIIKYTSLISFFNDLSNKRVA
ncbi:hypothetical protein [Flavivirga spongiicola]|uniref:VWA domain-containing protein n=1 Tax=Flavivirga spongiicola TaxID=421621 RepID=A0ABU7XYS5_9FLAO|nr:hypothetical protein [Flavivirga sp. MEBiC05379]MDO5980946.1 hypothetical protein [Flavivirga sp. MEBiC05379]